MKVQKKEIIEKMKTHPTDVGSCAVQIGLLSGRINKLAQHFSANASDFISRRGYLMLIGKRKKLLKYLKNYDVKQYNKVVEELSLNV